MAMHKKLFAVLLDQHFERTAPAEQRAPPRDYFAKPKELRGTGKVTPVSAAKPAREKKADPETWEFDVLRDGGGEIAKIKARRG